MQNRGRVCRESEEKHKLSENLTEPLAAFVSGLRYEDLPEPVVHQAKRFFLDAIGCAVGATHEDKCKASAAIALVDSFHADGPASVIRGGTSHPAFAALGNGMLINATDNDDTHKRALAHIGSVVVPAALATTEAVGGNGKDLIVALVAGYEVMARVGMAVMPTHYRFWHSTATNGTFGAAAAAARALRLDPISVRTAFGHAGTQAAGLNTFFESGDDTKSLHAGKAALNGVLSALMAQMGISSPPDIFGHPKGYLAAYSLEPKPEILLRGLGSEWMILENGFKFYPSILASHSPIGSSLVITARDAPVVAEIAAVTVRTYATVKSHFSNKDVQTSMAARLSVPYCVAVALTDGKVGQAQFQPERFNSAEVCNLLRKVEIIADGELTKLYPEKFPAFVTVTMNDGTTYHAETFYPKGDPENALSDDELARKFHRNVDGVMGETAAAKLADVVEALQVQADLVALGALLRKGAEKTAN